MMENNENVLDKISKLAFTTAIIGICTIGICPAFGAIGIAAPLVMKHRQEIKRPCLQASFRWLCLFWILCF